MMDFRRLAYVKKLFVLSSFMLSATTALAGEPTPSAADILDKLAKRYKACGSFSAEVVCKGAINPGTATGSGSETSAKIRFMRPASLLVDIEDRQSYGANAKPTPSNRYAIFCRQGQAYTFEQYLLPQGPAATYSKRASLQEATGAQAGVSKGLSNVVPSLLLGTYHPEGRAWTRGGDITIDGQPCYTLIGVTRIVGVNTTEWAVSKAGLELLQTKDSSAFTSEQTKKMMEEAEKQTGVKFSSMMTEFPAVASETTARYKNIRWNPSFKEADFDYVLPKEAKLVTDAEKMKMVNEQMKALKTK